MSGPSVASAVAGRSVRFSRVPWRTFVALVVALAVVGGAALDLVLPFDGDQALFALGAREMLGGSVLYVDFWDLKQPAIYAFFALARVLFGPGPVAVAALQACWDAALALVLATLARRTPTTRPVWLVAPLVGVVYAQIVRTFDGAAQVEALVGLPLSFALLATLEARAARRARATWAFGAGVAIAVAVLFKVLFAIVAVAMLVAALVGNRESRRDPVGSSATAALPFAIAFAAGATIVLGATLAWLGAHGALAAALATWFAIPPRIVRELPHQDVRVLASGLVDFVRTWIPIVALALVGVVAAVRSRAPSLVGAVAWLVAGIAVVSIQTTSWWAYQWQLVAVPMAFLATAGVAAAVRAAGDRRALVATALAIVLVAYPVAHARAKLALLVRHGFGLTVAERRAIGDALDPQQAVAREAAALVRARTSRDPYVFGNPLVYETLGARQPIALNGWSPELLVASQRRELSRELRDARPAVVFVAERSRPDYDRLVARSPEIAAYLARAYTSERTAVGTLFVRN